MWRSLWHRGLLSVLLTLGCACGLLVAPTAVTQRVRMVLCDAVAPGSRWFNHAHDWTGRQIASVRQAFAKWSGRTDSTVAATQPDAAVASAASTAEKLQLEAQIAALRAELAAAREGESRLLQRESSVPLVKTIAMAARVLGADQEQWRGLADRLVDAGSASGLAEGDLVLQPAATPADVEAHDLVLDQGSVSGIVGDAPVVAGGYLLGRIRHAGRLTSTVQPLTDPEFRIGARLVRMTPEGPMFGAVGVFAGSSGPMGQLNLVANTEPVTVGDRVYTHESVAGELLLVYIGTVANAEAPPGEPHWKITVNHGITAPLTRVDILKTELHPQRLAALPEMEATSHATETGP